MQKIFKISAKSIASDVRARLTDAELIVKYNLSLSSLEKVLRKLVKAHMLRSAEIKERGPLYDIAANRSETRRLPRATLTAPLAITDLSDASTTGLVIDLSENGFRTQGVSTFKGQEKRFFIYSHDFSDVDRVRIEATCVWVSPDSREAGFKIHNISFRDSAELRRLVGLLSFGEMNLNSIS